MDEASIRVLIVDPEISLRQPLANWLTREYGYELETAADGTEAINLILAHPNCYDVVLLEYLLPPPYNGLTLMEEIKHHCSETQTAFIIFTGWGLDPQVGVNALKAGAYRYMAKPFDREELAILIQSIVEVRRIKAKLEATSREKALLESLFEVSQVVNSTLSLEKVLELILNELKQVISYDSVTIQRIIPEGLQIVACRGFPEPARLKGRTFPRSEVYPNYRVWQSKQPLIEADMQETYQAQRVRGWLGVPLIYRGEAIGVITLDSQTPNFYNNEHARVATIFGNQAAIAIENARLYSQELRRAETLRGLLQVQQEVTRNITTQSKILLDKIAYTACQVTGADCAVIYPYLAETNKYDLANVAAFGLDGELTHQDKQRLAQGGGVSSLVLREGRIVIYDAAQDDPLVLLHNFVKREQIKAFVGIRLDATTPVGILFVNYRRPHTWTEDELALIDLFAGQAAVAIFNARLFGRTSDKLERKVTELRTIGEINQLITSTLNLDEVLRLILNKAMEMVRAQGGALQLADEESGELTLLLTQGSMEASLKQVRSEVMGKVVQDMRSIVVDDVAQSSWSNLPGPIKPQLYSELAVPLVIGKKCIGVLNFEQNELGYFTEDIQEAIEALAAQAAIAIQNAKQYKALQELDRKKTDFLSTVSHELRTPLTPVQSCMENLLSEMYGPVNDRQRARLETALTNVREEARLIENLLDLVRIQEDRARLELERKSVSKIIRDVIRVFEYDAEQKNIILISQLPEEDPLETRMDAGKIKQSLTNLVSNAVKFTPEGGKIQVTAARLEHCIEVQVEDTGIGIPQEAIAKVFDRFYQVDSSLTRKVGGMGIGLNITKEYIKMHGGEIRVESKLGQGTTFSFTLPLFNDAEVPV